MAVDRDRLATLAYPKIGCMVFPPEVYFGQFGRRMSCRVGAEFFA